MERILRFGRAWNAASMSLKSELQSELVASKSLTTNSADFNSFLVSIPSSYRHLYGTLGTTTASLCMTSRSLQIGCASWKYTPPQPSVDFRYRLMENSS